MDKIVKFSIYGFIAGVIYSLFSMGSFLLCKLTGFGMTLKLGINDCNVNYLLKPFAIFYHTISRGRGLFFTATNFILVGETLIILITFTIFGVIVGLIINKK